MKRIVAVLIVAISVVSCGGGKSNPTAASAPAPTLYNLEGTVFNAANGLGVGGATVRILDGVNAGKTATTNGGGYFAFIAIQPSAMTLEASASFYNKTQQSISLTGAGQSINFSLTPIPLFTRAGSGDTVFDMPTTVRRVRITGDYAGYSSNFIVHIAGSGVVNELLGDAWGGRHFEGTYVTSGGVVEILHSSGVQWTFTEVR